MLLKIVSRHPESFSQFRMEDLDPIEKVFEDVLKKIKSYKKISKCYFYLNVLVI